MDTHLFVMPVFFSLVLLGAPAYILIEVHKFILFVVPSFVAAVHSATVELLLKDSLNYKQKIWFLIVRNKEVPLYQSFV